MKHIQKNITPEARQALTKPLRKLKRLFQTLLTIGQLKTRKVNTKNIALLSLIFLKNILFKAFFNALIFVKF